MQRVLIIGATGMLGNACFRTFDASPGFEAWGTIRSASSRRRFAADSGERLIAGVDIESSDAIMKACAQAKPAILINCVGVVKQLGAAKDPLTAIPINALLPHRLATIAHAIGARLVHISTDCVFSGAKGNYLETDFPDADDLYGRSKLLGEVDYPHAVTLRTSIIGHELDNGSTGLVGWFLSQSGSVKGFRKAIFSGLPTCELARVIRDHVIPNPALRGLYHVSAAPIDKHSLLTLVRDAYARDIDIIADDALVIDRSLNSDRFRAAAKYAPPAWPDLVRAMHAFG